MKKAVVLIFLLIAAILVPYNDSAEGLTVPVEFALQIDPEIDVFEVEEGGAQTMVSGHDEIDILSVGAAVDTGNPVVSTDDSLVLSMALRGNVVTSNEEVKYAFIMSFSDSTFLALCNRSNISNSFNCIVVNPETGEKFVPPQPPVVSTDGKSFSIKIRLSGQVTASLGDPSTMTALKAAAADNRNTETKYADMAPDKLVKITSPSEGATIGKGGINTYAFRGVTHKSIDSFNNVEVKIGSGPWQDATTTDGWDNWTYTGSIAGATSISARATTTGGVRYTDQLSFRVGGSSDFLDSLDVLPGLHVGDKFVYTAVESQIFSVDDIQLTSDMNITIEKLEEIDIGSSSYTCFKVRTVQSGNVETPLASLEQNLERDSWRIADNFQTQQQIVKEYTHTEQSLERSGSSVNSAHTFTNITYDSPFDPGYLGRTVGEWWVASASGSQESKAVPADGPIKESESEPTKTARSEILRTEPVSLPSTLGGGFEECFIIKTSNGDNETSYTEYAYSDAYPVPLTIDIYDGNRELIGSLVLVERIIGSGVYPNVDEVGDVPERSDAGSTITIPVTITNQGDTDGPIWVALLANEKEVANVSSSGDVDAGATETLSVSWTPSEKGVYDLAIITQGGVMDLGVITIDPEPTSNYTLIFILIIGAVLAVVVILVALNRKGSNKLLEEHDAKMAGEPMPAPTDTPVSSEVTIEAGDVVIAAGAATVKPAGELTRTDEEKLKEVIGENTPVQCPKCSTTTSVVIDAKPYKFKCPECGAKLLLR